MKIKMRIVEIHPEQHSVVVRYYSDEVTEEMLADGASRRPDGSPWRCSTDRNLNIFQVPAPTGQALVDYIVKNCPPPREWIDLVGKVFSPEVDTSLSSVPVGKAFDVPAASTSAPRGTTTSAVAEVGPLTSIMED